MTYIPSAAKDFNEYVEAHYGEPFHQRQITVPHADAPKRPGLFKRILDALHNSRRRQAEAEIARYLRMSGTTRLTDQVEREIAHQLAGGRHTRF